MPASEPAPAPPAEPPRVAAIEEPADPHPGLIELIAARQAVDAAAALAPAAALDPGTALAPQSPLSAQTPASVISERPRMRLDARMIALTGWLLTVVVLGAVGWAAVAKRGDIIRAWPNSERAYAAIGLRK